VGPGELDIPAVRGLGGSLLYFVDGKTELGRLWDVDFEPIEMSSSSPAARANREAQSLEETPASQDAKPHQSRTE
jgi:4-hydroxyphenylpyruvate dioxygenase